MEELTHVDIIHTEDELSTIMRAELEAGDRELSYVSATTLEGLQKVLQSHRARIYLVDGKFPSVPDGEVIYNAPNAISAIREAAGEEAYIALVSGEANIDQIARAFSVVPVPKVDLLLARKGIIAAAHELLSRND